MTLLVIVRPCPVNSGGQRGDTENTTADHGQAIETAAWIVIRGGPNIQVIIHIRRLTAQRRWQQHIAEWSKKATITRTILITKTATITRTILITKTATNTM